jgi:hypothetical protein
MPENKIQHYIPQFYLRCFAAAPDERRIGVYNPARGIYVPEASIARQACRSDFYGADGRLERALMQQESAIAPIIRRIADTGLVPAWNSPEHHGLVAFIVLMHRRTQYAAEATAEMVNKVMKLMAQGDPRAERLGSEWRVVPKNPAMAAMFGASWLWPLALDLRMRVLRAGVAPGFVTSDNPVVFYNQYLEPLRPGLGNDGLGCVGLEVFLPLSNRYVLLLYDAHTYRVGRRQECQVPVTTRADLDAVNLLQAISSLRNLYFSPGVPREYLDGIAKCALPFRSTAKSVVRKYEVAGDAQGSLIHTRSAGVRCSLQLSFAALQRRTRHRKMPETAAWMRDPEILDLSKEFEELAKSGQARWGDFVFFLADKGKVKLNLPQPGTTAGARPQASGERHAESRPGRPEARASVDE